MSLLEDSSYYPIIRMKFGLAFFLIPIAVSYLIGIDFGSQFIKVAYQPFNRPPEIVSDASGKRKIDNSIFFGDDLRSFGNIAESTTTTKPEYVYSGMNEILGQGAESNKPASFQQRGYPYEFVLTERNTWALRLLPGSGFTDISSVTAEELNGMILDYIVSIVHKGYGETSRDVVISIPSSFTQQQRQAILDAARLVDIHVLSLIDQTTASAVTFAMTRAGKGVKRLLVYDVGSHYTEVSAVEIESIQDNTAFKRNVIVLGKESTEVGGNDFTNVVTGILADRFEQEYHVDPRQDAKTNARLRSSSQKYKEILSANREVEINENGLYGGKDLHFVLQRDEFDEDALNVVEAILQPLQTLLERLNLSVVRMISVCHK